MAFVFITVTKIEGNTGSSANASVASTAGNVLLATCSAYEGANSTNTLSMSGGGTWTTDISTNYDTVGDRACDAMCSCPSATGGTQTITVSGGNASGAAAGVYEFSGAPATPFLDGTPPAIATGSSTSATTNSCTNTNGAQAVFVAVVGVDVSNSQSITGNSTGWVYPAGAKQTDGTSFWCWASGYKIVTIIGAETSNWTIANVPWGTMIAAYDASTGLVGLDAKYYVLGGGVGYRPLLPI